MAENSPSFVHQQMYEERAVFYAPLRTAHVYRRKAIVGLAHPSGVQPASGMRRTYTPTSDESEDMNRWSMQPFWVTEPWVPVS